VRKELEEIQLEARRAGKSRRPRKDDFHICYRCNAAGALGEAKPSCYDINPPAIGDLSSFLKNGSWSRGDGYDSMAFNPRALNSNATEDRFNAFALRKMRRCGNLDFEPA
jgi:hypothetical protein